MYIYYYYYYYYYLKANDSNFKVAALRNCNLPVEIWSLVLDLEWFDLELNAQNKIQGTIKGPAGGTIIPSKFPIARRQNK